MSEARAIGHPEGETTFIERVVRVTHADGTITDTPPTRVTPVPPGPMARLQGGLRAGVAGLAAQRDGKVTYLYREVTVTVGPWVEGDPAELQVTEDGFCSRLLCGHGKRRHPAGGPCEACGNQEKCESFVGRERDVGATDGPAVGWRKDGGGE